MLSPSELLSQIRTNSPPSKALGDASGGLIREAEDISAAPVKPSLNSEFWSQRAAKVEIKEETVQIDELSAKKIDKYLDAADTDREILTKPNETLVGRFYKRQHRSNGIAMAINKKQGAAKVSPTKESVEQVDELSKDTLKQYTRQSSTDAAKRALNIGAKRFDTRKQEHKLVNRLAGVHRATERMAREETVDEASPDILKRYGSIMPQRDATSIPKRDKPREYSPPPKGDSGQHAAPTKVLVNKMRNKLMTQEEVEPSVGTIERRKVDVTARPGAKEDPKSSKSKLARNGAFKTRVIDERVAMLRRIIQEANPSITHDRIRKETGKDGNQKVKLTGGKTKVDLKPKLSREGDSGGVI